MVLLARVRQRVVESGNDVPAERILARYPRTLENLTRAVRLADMAMLFDTGKVGKDQVGRTARVAVCRGSETKLRVKTLPRWAKVVPGQSSAAQ